MNILTAFSKTIISGALIISSVFSGLLGINNDNQNSAVLGGYNTAAGGTYRLQTSLGSSDTTVRLSSFKDPRNDALITMTYLNTSIAYGTLDPQQPSRSELISFTGVTQNSDGSASLTGVTRGLLGVYPYTASSTLRKTHAGQSIFILSDAPQVFNEYAAKQNNETITGQWTFSSTTAFSAIGTSTFTSPVTFNGSTTHNAFNFFNASSSFTGTTTFTNYLSSAYDCSGTSPLTSLCNKQYIDGVATSGAPDASTVQKGVAQEATASDVNLGISTGSTGARLFISPGALASSTVITTALNTALSSSTFVFSQPTVISSFTTTALSSSTNGWVALINLPTSITASKMSIIRSAPGDGSAGTSTFALFDSTGQRKIFQATTSIPLVDGTLSFNIATTSISLGTYYVAVVADNALKISLRAFSDGSASANGNLQDLPGEPGRIGLLPGITAGVMPATINPNTIATTSNSTYGLWFRLDN